MLAWGQIRMQRLAEFKVGELAEPEKISDYIGSCVARNKNDWGRENFSVEKW